MESAFKGLNLKDMLVFEGSQQEILPPLPDLTWFVFRLYVFFKILQYFLAIISQTTTFFVKRLEI